MQDREHSHQYGEYPAELEREREDALAPGRVSSTAQIQAPSDPIVSGLARGPLQFRGDGYNGDDAHAIAASGLGSGASSLPHIDQISASFGDHDVRSIRAHTGSAATSANEQLNAEAYAYGDDVAFRGNPDLHTAAHEAAHVIQQRAGVGPSGGVGSVGDAHEQQADAVADLVVAGKSAAPVLDQIVGGASVASVQRKALQLKTEAKGGVDVGTDGVAVGLTVAPGKEFEAGYAKIKVSAPISGQASLKSKKPPGKVNVGGGEDSKGGQSGKASVEIYKNEAVAAGSSELAKLAYGSIESAGYEIDTVSLEGEFGTGKSAAGNETTGVSVGVKFSFKNGNSQVVKAQLFENEKGGDLSGPKIELEHKFSIVKKTLWENDIAQLEATLDLALKLEVKPEWRKIWTKLGEQIVEKGGAEAAKQMMRSVMAAVTGEMLVGGALIAGGLLVVFVGIMEMEALSEIKAAERGAHKALDSFCAGYCSGMGVKQFAGGGVAGSGFYTEGSKVAKGKVDGAIAKIRAHPLFKKWNFTEAELRTALLDRLSQHGGEIYKQAEAEAKPLIFQQFVIQFYHKQAAGWLTPKYIARNDAKVLARMLNVPESVIPVD